MSKTQSVKGGLVYSPAKPKVTEPVLEAAVLQAARHQFRLDDDDFYSDPTLAGKGTIRRVSVQLQRKTQGELRARYTDQVQQHAHDLFHGRLGFKQLFDACFAAKGADEAPALSSHTGVRSMLAAWDRAERGSIEAEGASNLSISNVLANVLNKFSLQGYLFEEQSWREIAAIRPVKDFKQTKSIPLFGDLMFKQLAASGELASASLGDAGLTNQAAEYGRILTIPWVDIINDDMHLLTRAPLKIGSGAGLALNDAFWTLWASLTNLNGDDGNAFWRTTSSSAKGKSFKANKATGAGSALSSAALTTAMDLFHSQTDPYGNPLGFRAATPRLLYPPSLWLSVMQLLAAPAQVAAGAALAAPGDKTGAYLVKPVMSRYLEYASYGNSSTGWYVVRDPAAVPVIEVLFLDGIDTPTVLRAGPDYQFDRLGVAIRGIMAFGVGAQNFRGGVYSAGA